MSWHGPGGCKPTAWLSAGLSVPASPALSSRQPEILQLGQLQPIFNCMQVTRCHLGKRSMMHKPFGQQVQQLCCEKSPVAAALSVWPVPLPACVLVRGHGGMAAPCPCPAGPLGYTGDIGADAVRKSLTCPRDLCWCWHPLGTWGTCRAGAARCSCCGPDPGSIP